MKSLVYKVLSNTITEKELIELSKWLEEPKNQEILKDHIRDYHDLNLAFIKNNVGAAFEKVMRKIEAKERPVRSLIPNWIKYAAVIALFLGLGYVYQQGLLSSNEKISIPDESITLELDNGNIEILHKDGRSQVLDKEGNVVGSQKGGTLVYDNVIEKEKLVYNTIKVPYAKRFNVQLSDGTNVYLNAGSSLKYPVNFIEGMDRQVFLSGEAFFDVSKDTLHSFVVNADDLNVKVYGTKFNVSSYPEDEFINTVLVEGSVGLYGNSVEDEIENTTVLDPGFKGEWNRLGKKISTSMVDTSVYTAWVDGKIIFSHLPFKNIIKKLERHYDVEIENKNEALNEEVFTASFDIETIEQVLSSFNKNYAIKYSINDNYITIY